MVLFSFILFQVNQDYGEEKAVFSIPSSVRGDTAKYTITAKNDFGEDSGDITVIVLGAFFVCFSCRITCLFFCDF